MKHSQTVLIINQKGLHARASVKLAELAAMFNCDITLSNNTTDADAKNVLQLMMLAASKGTQLELHCEGEDAETAGADISNLVANCFDEET
jgi:phosphocarrier protein